MQEQPMTQRPPVPPFTLETAIQKVRAAEDASRSPERLFRWPQGRRPDHHPGLTELGL
jgi:nuclear transport factor 2 (NTF2) superfamily protein